MKKKKKVINKINFSFCENSKKKHVNIANRLVFDSFLKKLSVLKKYL